MQLVDFRTRLRKRIQNPSITSVPDTDLTQAINLAYAEIINKFRFHKGRKQGTIVTAAGTRLYDIPVDAKAIFSVRDLTNGVKLIKIGDREISELVSGTIDPDPQGRPTRYVRYIGKIEVDPTPDAVYTLEFFYKAEPVALAADADVTVTPPSWDEGIIRLASHYYWMDAGDEAKSISAYNFYGTWASSQPVEVDEEKVDIDSGVSIPTLTNNQRPRQDFNTAD